MTSLSEHLSAVRQSQWEAQLDVFRTLTTRALDSAEQLIALNLKTSRVSVEQAAGTMQQLMHVTDPRDLLAIGSQAQGQWQHLFSYSRELLGIAAGARQLTWTTPAALHLFPAPTANIPTSVPQILEQAAIATAQSTTVTSEIAAAAADTGAALAEATLSIGKDVAQAAETAPAQADAAAPAQAGAAAPEMPPSIPSAEEETQANVEALVDVVIADEAPPAKAKPLVQALSEIAPKPVSAEHPLASTVPLETNGQVELPVVTPAELAPPVHLAAATPAGKPGRASRRK
jgi:hypothetical protein